MCMLELQRGGLVPVQRGGLVHSLWKLINQVAKG